MIYNTQFCSTRSRRRGIVLLVVLALLVLFSVVGLSFVYYAEAEASAANVNMRAQSPLVADVDPEALLKFFLGQLIFDVHDTPPLGPSAVEYRHHIGSALRGHSLARNMYGAAAFITNQAAAPATLVNTLNVTPFNGVSRDPRDGAATIIDPYLGQPVHQLINHQYHKFDGPAYFGTPFEFIRDPEWYGLKPRDSSVGANWLAVPPAAYP
ncbi:MAG: hypothetical protein NZO58_10215, partial [Gemmataceae bacterium]|nr:hypothetical protein [Gemmataceae bacterium]